MVSRETSSWRRLALAAAATIVLLVTRVLLGRPLARKAAPAGEWWDESSEDELRRRLGAVEANVREVWEVLNARDADSGGR